jgi:hypothetical protein
MHLPTYQLNQVVHFIFETGSGDETAFEALHKGAPLIGKYSAILHKAHVPGGQDHLHVFARQNQLFALNRDGSAHDRNHGIQIPNRVADAIRNAYPEFTLPPDSFIEAAPSLVDEAYQLLCD